ncbi:MAG: DUF1566 domain-containing protein [Geobacteraceae bacterium]|nr:DUF1566 domain-containing protein [Geobacteraceae bacterium]
MRQLFRSAVFLCICLPCLTHPLFAAEVTNLRTHFSSTRLAIEYDLHGKSGEKSSGIEILLRINGKQYSSNMLSLSGDFGRSIALGKNRHILWMHPQDFPEGLDATFKCIVNAVPNRTVIAEGITPAEGFRATYYAVNRQTIVDKRTHRMWTRNANISIRPMQHSTAEKTIKQLNHDRYAGYNDWRMPTREEFEGLVLSGTKAGWGTAFTHFIADYLPTCGFTQVQPGNYWTSTTSVDGTDLFFVANTWNGILRPLSGANYYYLWPVRTSR